MGIKDWDQYNRNLVSGTPINTPRIVPAPGQRRIDRPSLSLLTFGSASTYFISP